VQPGVCLRLVPRSCLESLELTTPPEMQRVPLESIYLQVCASGIQDRHGFLSSTPDPPEHASVKFAAAMLSELGALDDSSTDGLTALGRHLASLPCHPRLGKILVLGCLLLVPGPILSICAAMSGRSPLMTTQDKEKRDRWQVERERLIEEIGHKSDHCAWAVFMYAWQGAITRRRELGRKYGLSFERMTAAMFERKHLSESLVQAGLLPRIYLEDNWHDRDVIPDWSVVRSAVVGGLCPNIVHVERALNRNKVCNSQDSKHERAKQLRYSVLQRSLKESSTDSFPKNVSIHPNSLCFGEDHYHCPWLAFYNIQLTSRLWVYDVSEVNPYALLLFGAEPRFNEKSAQVEVAGWVRFKCAAGMKLLSLIEAARAALQEVLELKLADSNLNLASSKGLMACIELLRTNGLGFSGPPGRGLGYPLASLDHTEHLGRAREGTQEAPGSDNPLGNVEFADRPAPTVQLADHLDASSQSIVCMQSGGHAAGPARASQAGFVGRTRFGSQRDKESGKWREWERHTDRHVSVPPA